MRVSLATQSTDSSRTFHTRPSRPPGLSTRANSSSVARLLNQWKACAQTMAPSEPLPKPVASAVPACTRRRSCGAMRARMASTGSTATTLAPVASSKGVNLPVPAPTSATVRAGPRPSASRTQSCKAPG